MNRTKIFLITCLMLATAVSDCLAQSGCSLLDKSKSAQYITYESLSGADAQVKFRFTNNTTCPVTVETDDRYPTQVARQPNGGLKIETVTESRDGVTVPLHYLIQDRKRWRAPEPGYGWGDSVFTYSVPAGQSVLFAAPLKHFKKRLDLVVPFKYAWESDGTIGGGVGGVTHRVHFLIEDLPKEIMKKRD
jgi:hypothetical protein